MQFLSLSLSFSLSLSLFLYFSINVPNFECVFIQNDSKRRTAVLLTGVIDCFSALPRSILVVEKEREIERERAQRGIEKTVEKE